MTVDPTGWGVADFAAALRRGVPLDDIVEGTLTLLAVAPPGVLIGEPLTDFARAECARLRGVDPAALPLYGVPFVVKDNIDVGGVPTTMACPGAAFVPTVDAEVVARVRAAGAIVVGKANLDQFATGLVGTRSPYGTPPNVLDPLLVPGGSSSGSAVAVALGLVPFALGTDTAGSGRVPAALNGIVGIKPTVGAMSTRGVFPAVRSLDCPSVFARTVADAAAVAGLMRGHDPLDPRSRRPVVLPPIGDRPAFGVPSSWPGDLVVEDSMRGWFDASIDVCRALGARIVPVDIRPLVELGSMLYGSAFVAQRAASFGQAFAKGLEGLDPVVGSVIDRAARYSAEDAYRADEELVRRGAAAQRIWDEIDVLALPTTPVLATLADVRRDPLGVNEALGRLTTFANLADTCAIVVPMRGGVPAGLQLIAPAWHDDDLVTFATTYESQAAPATAS